MQRIPPQPVRHRPRTTCKISWETTPKRWSGFRQFLPGVRRVSLEAETKKCRCQVFRANQEGLETVYGTVG
ncbi:hypothetical protein CQ393_05815 [Stenotrophomonas sp. MYb238]|nr:hypothetical protein [Stenotrophomonas sp. MYb238]